MQWYIKVCEKGVDASNVIKDYFRSLDKIILLEKQIEAQKKESEKKLRNATRQIKEVFEKLKMQQEKVIKPLLLEVKVKDAII